MELSPAAWHWAKPRERPPAKLELPEASPRGREGGPAVTGRRGGAKAPGPVTASNEAVKAPGPVAASNAAAKAPAPEGIKGLVKEDRSPVGLIRLEATGRVLTAISGVDQEKMPAAADGEADGELAELSKAWKATL